MTPFQAKRRQLFYTKPRAQAHIHAHARAHTHTHTPSLSRSLSVFPKKKKKGRPAIDSGERMCGATGESCCGIDRILREV